MFIQETFIDKLSVNQQILVSNMFGNLVMLVADGITNIQVERDSINLPVEDQVPPVLPHELVKLKGRNFTSIVIKHLSCLKQFWTDERISKLELQHHELLLLYQHNPGIRSELDKCDIILHPFNLAKLFWRGSIHRIWRNLMFFRIFVEGYLQV